MSKVRHQPAAAQALLADGTTVTIRPLSPADHAAVLDLHARRMSPGNQRLRFFAMSRLAPAESAARLCAAPRAGFLALGAVAADGGPHERLVGVVEYHVIEAYDGDGRPDQVADFAVAVADDWHDQGIATLLIEHMAHAARSRGIRVLQADVLAENVLMHKVFADLGLHVERLVDGPEVRALVRLDEGAEAYRASVDERGRRADVASLIPLLQPRSVAVLGVSRRPGSVGRSVLLKIRQGHFQGRLWAVHPKRPSVAGAQCYPSVAGLPGVPDLAVLAVPADQVPTVAEECGRAGVRALVVLSAGLDRNQARTLLDSCRRHSMRMVGPNCLGIASTDPLVRLDAQFGTVVPAPGNVGIAVQSGGVGIALMEHLNALGLGVSDFVSLGDKYDVSSNDLLQWWESDDRTDLAILHLESFGNPRAFSRTAGRVARSMPILTVDAGRSAAGRRGAAARTAAAAGSALARETLFAQAGVTATRGIAELVEAAALMQAQPLPGPSGRVAVVSNAAGIGVLAADACADAGLGVPELSADLVRDLLGVLPTDASTVNPLDTTPAVGPGQLAAAVDLLVRSGSVDAVLLCLAPTALAEDPLRDLRAAAGRRDCPIVLVDLAQQPAVGYLPTQDGSRLPSYADPQTAARALAHARDRARWLAEPSSVVSDPAGVDSRTAETLVRTFLAENAEGGTLGLPATARLLHCYGLPVSASPSTAAEHGAGLFAGVVQDQVFGPLVLFGSSGTTSALDHRAARLAPLTRADIRALLTSPRSSPLLPGHRGTPVADLDALEDLLARLSQMACDLPELAEVDLGLRITGTGDRTCADARVRLEPRRTPDPYLRRLRRIPGADGQ